MTRLAKPRFRPMFFLADGRAAHLAALTPSEALSMGRDALHVATGNSQIF
jgi:hypothetical protein